MATQSKSAPVTCNMAQIVNWDEVFKSELPRVYNYFLYKIGNKQSAEDLTATTFERAWKFRSRYDATKSKTATWIFGIARNVIKEHFRKINKLNREVEQVEETDKLTSNTDIEQKLQQKQRREYLQNIILTLPDRERELIALKYGAGITNRRIAKITGLSETNVGTILYRTVKKLREKWEAAHG